MLQYATVAWFKDVLAAASACQKCLSVDCIHLCVLKTLILIELVADIYWQKIGGATNELALNGCRMSNIICHHFSVLKNAGSASG